MERLEVVGRLAQLEIERQVLMDYSSPDEVTGCGARLKRFTSDSKSMVMV